MKVITKTIASISLSLLTIGTFAQNIVPAKAIPVRTSRAIKTAKINRLNAHKPHPSSGGTNAYIDYPFGDALNTGASFYTWFPPMYTNIHYTLKDTLKSPLTSASSNVYTPTGVSVSFDTLWDAYSQSFLSPPAGSVSVDTIEADIGYYNTSGKNDTIIFQVCAVNVYGAPTNVVYGSVTTIITSNYFAYNSLDSVQHMIVIPQNPIAIPSNARNGWNFAITMKVSGSKKDTIGPYYQSQGAAYCPNGGGGYYTNAYSSMGAPGGDSAFKGFYPCAGFYPMTEENSFVSGLYWFNDKKNHGSGAGMTWPTINNIRGYELNDSGYIWYDNGTLSCPTDTLIVAWQDIAIYAAVSYVATSVNSVNNAGLSINQNYPNPFNKSTQITYNLAKTSNVSFSICDMTGRMIVNNVYNSVTPGKHEINLNANTFAPGIYFYTFKVNGNEVTKKMVITE